MDKGKRNPVHQTGPEKGPTRGERTVLDVEVGGNGAESATIQTQIDRAKTIATLGLGVYDQNMTRHRRGSDTHTVAGNILLPLTGRYSNNRASAWYLVRVLGVAVGLKTP